MEHVKDEMVTITTNNGKTIEVNKMIYHFMEFLKLYGEDVSDISATIITFLKFTDYWADFKKSENDPTINNPHLIRFNLWHTIKPKTQYAHQQEFRNKKPSPYPIYRIANGTVHSMSPGGNYPLKECIIYVSDGDTLTALK